MDESGPSTSRLFNTTAADNRSATDSQDKVQLASMYLRYNFTYLLWLIVPPVLLILGCFGNVMTMVVMRGMRASTSESTACLSVYFTALAFSDLILLITAVLWDWPDMAFGTMVPYFSDLPCTVPFFVLFLTSMTSAWFLVAMTCQRLMSVVLPLRVGVLCTVKRGKMIVAVIVLLSSVANMYIFFIYRLQNVDGVYEECVSIDKDLAGVFKLMDLFLAALIPFLIIIVANCVLIRKAMQSMRMTGKVQGQANSRSDQVSSMTSTLIATSTAFLVLTLPTCLFDLYMEAVGLYKGEIEDENLSEQLAVVDTVFAMVWMSNSAVNFYIYVLSGSKFREETKRCLCACFKRLR
ncbi:hypothetical protein ACOMHN_011126 [Nucella lapillus]